MPLIKVALAYNGIDRQTKTSNNSLSIIEWNNIINALSTQTNTNTKAIKEIYNYFDELDIMSRTEIEEEFAKYLKTEYGIIAIANTGVDLSSFSEGQNFFVLNDKTFRYKSGNTLVLSTFATIKATNIQATSYSVDGTTIITKGADGKTNIDGANGVHLEKETTYKSEGEIASKTYVSNNYYNKSYINTAFADKSYVDERLQQFQKDAHKNVDTDTYPTLASFQDSVGEEGYVYLYPIDIYDNSKGFHQYIWESQNDSYVWQYLGTTLIDLSNIAVNFTQSSFADGNIVVDFNKNTDTLLVPAETASSITLVIPSNISQGWIASCSFPIGDVVPVFNLTNNSIYDVFFVVNNRKADLSEIAISLDTNCIVECLAECNGFNIRVYMKGITF